MSQAPRTMPGTLLMPHGCLLTNKHLQAGAGTGVNPHNHTPHIYDLNALPFRLQRLAPANCTPLFSQVHGHTPQLTAAGGKSPFQFRSPGQPWPTRHASPHPGYLHPFPPHPHPPAEVPSPRSNQTGSLQVPGVPCAFSSPCVRTLRLPPPPRLH